MGKYSDLFVGMDSLQEFIVYVHDAVHTVLIAGDGHCKSYEGSVSVHFPSFFEMTDPNHQPPVTLKLACYVLGPSRSYYWESTNVAGCIEQARTDIEGWLAEEAEDE